MISRHQLHPAPNAEKGIGMAFAPRTRAPLAIPLIPGISMTLIEDENGCAFGSWARADGIVLLPPSEQDRQRRFATPQKAVAFFRARYEALPRG